MRIVHYILLSCCVFFVAACGSSDPEFPREEILTLELMPLQGITAPTSLEVKHPFLILENSDSRRDSIFHIYDLNNYELKSVFGRRGRGPGEFIYPALLISQLPEVLIMDAQNDLRTYFFNIDENGQFVLKDTKQPAFDGVPNIAIINDSLYVRDDMFRSPTLQVFSFSDKQPRRTWQYGDPVIIVPWMDPNYGNLYANKERIVFCYRYKKQIEFMDTNLNHIKRVKFKHDSPGSITEDCLEDIKISYSAGYMGKRYLYAMYRGVSGGKYGGDPDFRGSVLEVFDLDGNPVIRYRMDGIAPIHFVVDEETFTLYGIHHNFEPEDHLLVYRLKGL
ncbi:MAG: TolB-like 6-bladed beta-propeller domain-containing protein [Rikenellaceae bacterium]|nr:TolB-like 6-bladed beta-propeller domain-containing protein [Rikenellaceae bacterium]MCL2692998.1 TolB-like 6-bladed beta-propeller domain-containing protein [Rikenellaceae bacterium]